MRSIFSYITEVMTRTYFFQMFVTNFGIIYDNCANLILCNSLGIADDTKLYYGNKKNRPMRFFMEAQRNFICGYTTFELFLM